MFAFQLALALGMPVQKMMREMTAREFELWKAFYVVSPFGEVRKDLRAGMVAAPILNQMIQKNRHKPSKWVMQFRRPLNKTEQMKYALMQWTIAKGGTVHHQS